MVRSHYQSKWLFHYQAFLAVGAVFFFFTFLDTYVVTQQITSSPVGWMLPYFALTIPLFIQGKLKIPSRFLLGWCIGYFLITFVSYFLFSSSEISLRVLIDRAFSSIFLLVTACLFADKKIQSWVRSALVVATLIGVINNCYQYVNPSAFAGLNDSRVSGLYMDPNDCSYALVLGMMFTVGLFSAKLRIPWILIVGLGITITFSRGGTLSWLLTVLIMYLVRMIDAKQAGFWILGFAAFLLGLILLGSDNNLADLGVANEGLFGRIDGIINGETLYDPSAEERKGIAEKAWEMFLEHPLFGYGVGSTSDFSITGFPVSTHNMYLLHAAEYGVFGIPILPLAIYASTYHVCGKAAKIATVFTLFILIASIFSHTVLDQRSYLIAFALMTAMSVSSQIYPDCSSNHLMLRRRYEFTGSPNTSSQK